MMAGHPSVARPDWLTAIRRYPIATFGGNLAWETAHMPLYTLWHTGTTRDITQAIIHCTLGDLVIATVALIVALVVAGSPAWPYERAGSVMAVMIAAGVGYTVYSEYLNTVVRGAWTYTEWMPTMPWLGTGLSPLAQWLIIPTVTLVWAGRTSPIGQQPRRAAIRHE
jgi:hypothetical protein